MVDIQIIKRIVKEEMSELEGTAHSYEHVDRVLKIATSWLIRKMPIWREFK